MIDKTAREDVFLLMVQAALDGHSHHQIAALAGYSPTYVTLVLNGKRPTNPSPDLVLAQELYKAYKTSGKQKEKHTSRLLARRIAGAEALLASLKAKQV